MCCHLVCAAKILCVNWEVKNITCFGLNNFSLLKLHVEDFESMKLIPFLFQCNSSESSNKLYVKVQPKKKL